MNTQEIKEKAEKLLDNFEGVFARDELPSKRRRNRMFVMNTDTSNLPGTHWVAVIVRNNIGYCFDPLGFAPSTTLSNWMNQYYKKWNSNTDRHVQPLYSNLCGYYCLYFLFWSSTSFMTQFNFNTILDKLFPKSQNFVQYEQTIIQFKNTI